MAVRAGWVEDWQARGWPGRAPLGLSVEVESGWGRKCWERRKVRQRSPADLGLGCGKKTEESKGGRSRSCASLAPSLIPFLSYLAPAPLVPRPSQHPLPTLSLPTAFLPRLPRLLEDLPFPDPSAHLLALLDRLRNIYASPSHPPPPPPVAKKAPHPHPRHAFDSGYSSEEDDAHPQSTARDDAFERAWAKDWLLQLVRRGQAWVEALDGANDDEEERRVLIVDRAASLVSELSQASESGSIVRPLLLPTSQHQETEPLLITLFDALPSAHDFSGVGLQSWGSSIILARMIALDPDAFGVRASGGRTLELGAGTGLLSLVWRAMSDRALAAQPPSPNPSSLSSDEPSIVLATDFHAGVLENLRRNVSDNTPLSPSPTCALSVHKLDWAAVHASRSFALSAKNSLVMPAPFDKPFDTLLAADVVYAPEHALWLRSCCEQFLARPPGAPIPPYASPYPSPTSSPSLRPIDAMAMTRADGEREGEEWTTLPFLPCETSAFHLIVPLRPTHQLAIASIAETFPAAEDLVGRRKKGDWKIAVQSVVEVERVRGVGRVDEGSYRLYRIGWC